jgi:putative DNA primase/helicase
MAKEGACARLGAPPIDGAPILVCEGYATGLSIRQALERAHTVFVAFDAGNLAPVATILRQRYPSSPLIFCADDDWKTEIPKGTPFNVGVKKASAAARLVGRAWVVVPLFMSATRQDKWTDFNDLHAAHGLEAVRDQLDVTRIMRELPPIEREGAIDSPPRSGRHENAGAPPGVEG